MQSSLKWNYGRWSRKLSLYVEGSISLVCYYFDCKIFAIFLFSNKKLKIKSLWLGKHKKSLNSLQATKKASLNMRRTRDYFQVFTRHKNTLSRAYATVQTKKLGRLPKHWKSGPFSWNQIGEKEMSKKQERLLQSARHRLRARKKWCGAGVRDETQQPSRVPETFWPIRRWLHFIYIITPHHSVSRCICAPRHLVKECICRRTTMPINYASAFPGPLFFFAQVQSGRRNWVRRISCVGNPSLAHIPPLACSSLGRRMARGYLLFFLLAKLLPLAGVILVAGVTWPH